MPVLNKQLTHYSNLGSGHWGVSPATVWDHARDEAQRVAGLEVCAFGVFSLGKGISFWVFETRTVLHTRQWSQDKKNIRRLVIVNGDGELRPILADGDSCNVAIKSDEVLNEVTLIGYQEKDFSDKFNIYGKYLTSGPESWIIWTFPRLEEKKTILGCVGCQQIQVIFPRAAALVITFHSPTVFRI